MTVASMSTDWSHSTTEVVITLENFHIVEGILTSNYKYFRYPNFLFHII